MDKVWWITSHRSINSQICFWYVRQRISYTFYIIFIISNNLKTLLQTFKASEHAKDAYVHKLRAMEKKAADLVIAKFSIFESYG